MLILKFILLVNGIWADTGLWGKDIVDNSIISTTDAIVSRKANSLLEIIRKGTENWTANIIFPQCKLMKILYSSGQHILRGLLQS